MQIPVIAAAWTGPPHLVVVIAILAYLYFGALVFFAVRTIVRTGEQTAAAIVLLSRISQL